MTYRELIVLYKNGKLDEAQKKQVEADIERQEVISEYLFDAEEIPELEDLLTSHGESGAMCMLEQDKMDEASKIATGRWKDENAELEERFVKMIRGSIRKAFVKMGICVGAVLLLAVLFIMFCLPGIVDQFYYNPAAVAAEGEYSKTNQMSLDMAVYSELFLPGKYRNNVMVDSNGYGEYDINIVQNASITDRFYNVAGKVEKGELTLYDVNLLTRPTGNAFVPSASGMKITYVGSGPAGSKQEAYEKLYTLNQNGYYMAYITLSEVMTYAEYKEWFDTQNLPVGSAWCAVAEKTEDGYYVNDIMGFSYSLGGMCMNFDKEKYPHLTMLEEGAEGWPEDDPETMQTHFVSMLRYMGDQEEFCKMIGADEYHIDWYGMAQNIEENGLYIYGFAVQAKPDALITLSEMEEVSYIYAKSIQ